MIGGERLERMNTGHDRTIPKPELYAQLDI